jgi:hypothetical protein
MVSARRHGSCRPAERTPAGGVCLFVRRRRSGGSGTREGLALRGILLWLLGIPIPIIILLYLFNVI